MYDLFEVKQISPKKGKGLVAKTNIKRGTLLIVAHVILIPNREWESIKDTILYNYTFIWDDPEKTGEYFNAIPLSICQFINHSYKPNIYYLHNYENLTLEFYSRRLIREGEELTVNYNGKTFDKAAVWFEVEEE